MKARLIAFGEIELTDKRYDYDLVIDGGKVRRRVKKPSKPLRDRFVAEHLPVAQDEGVDGELEMGEGGMVEFEFDFAQGEFRA